MIMGKRQFITLRTANSNEETDMEVPSDRPVAEVLPEILKILNWPLTDENGEPLYYALTDDARVQIPSDKTFPEADVDNFEIVHVILDETQKQRILDKRKSAPAERIPGTARADENDGALSKPVPFMPPIIGPCLLSASGMMFMIGGLPALIGRKSSGTVPQVDLTELDKQLKSSRSHAEIVRQDDHYALHVLKPKNGMMVNGNALDPNAVFPLKDGDILQFGFQGVQLTWREPKAQEK